MPWRRAHSSHCRKCGHERQEGELLSARGNCHNCGVQAVADNAVQLHYHDGPYFDHWRARMLASFGIVLDENAD